MKQALVKKGIVLPVQVPVPAVKPGFVRIKVLYSCISTGTELKGLSDSRATLLKKAIGNPEKVKTALQLLKSRGLRATAKKISASEDSMKSQGYSISGVIVEIGSEVTGFQVGDLVAGGGQGFAVHAEYVVIPKNLVTKVPIGVKPEDASIATVGSIALHGVRRIDLKLGEFGVVYGSGLLGLLALQMLCSSGVRVACIDIDDSRLKLAAELGADIMINSNSSDPVHEIHNWTGGLGADAVLYTAATSESKPLSDSFKMCRRKGRVVIVGVVPLNIERSDIYKNEIDLLISSSYGPGRYDDKYEIEGIDYPYAYVRWTENRNMSEFLRLVQNNKVLLEPLNPSIYSIDNVSQAYEDLKNQASTHLISLIQYGSADDFETDATVNSSSTVIIKQDLHPSKKVSPIQIGLIGAGGFASGVLLPIIKSMQDKFQIKTIANRNGEKAFKVARQFNAAAATSDYMDILNDASIDLVMICTRHDSHADLVIQALKKDKHVYVEKPLATNTEDLDQIKNLFLDNKISKQLMVGFNRRFSTYANELFGHCSKRQSPLFMRYRMNAGYIPYDSWVHNDGGRIVGEACHIIDLMSYLSGSEVVELSVNPISPGKGRYQSTDNRSIVMKFTDGSIGVLDYFAMGNKELPKENLEVHFDGKSIIVDDYKGIIGYGVKVRNISSRASLKGHEEEWLAVYNAIITGQRPISPDSLIKTTEISILAAIHS